jgi:tripartite ATP-independent transporter DctM subunit
MMKEEVLAAVPLFIFMGYITEQAGLMERLFRVLQLVMAPLRGSLYIAVILTATVFAMATGIVGAAVTVLGIMAAPIMMKSGYSPRLSAGAIAAGGTLGILVPPSTIMVIYGIMTETNIGRLFAAGVLPGILAAFLLCLAVRYAVWREPDAGPAGESSPWATRWRALRGVWGVAALFAVSIGGIYAGVFTATEGAGFGAFGAFLFALTRQTLSWSVLRDVLLESARTTSMLFMILIGALVFANFINFTSMPRDLQHFVERFALHPTMVVAAMCSIYVILGTAMEELSMILLTVPVFFPVVVNLGFDPVWFGILVVVVVEIGMISPPVGMNLFVISALLPHVPTPTLFRGVAPFVVADVVRLLILLAFPIISLWLPSVLRIAGKGY